MSTAQPAERPRARTRGGVIAGAAVKAIREGTGLTQARLAEDLGVDVNTVQSWESGRRPLTSARVAALAGLRRRLTLAGATRVQLAAIDAAIEADHILQRVLDVDPAAARDHQAHPLTASVHHRDVTEALGWPFTGVSPDGLGGAAAPLLGADERAAFFARLRRTVETSQRRHPGVGDAQPHRQLYYMLAWDRAEQTRAWMAVMERAERRGWVPSAGWTPRWVTARSVAISRARHGDPGPLREFTDVGLRDPRCQDADLAYWSYWLGDLDGAWLDDAAMTRPAARAWPGGRLLARFGDRLVHGEPLLDLYAASTSALVQSRPALLAEPRHAGALLTRAERLLDGDLHSGTRRHIEDLRFGLRLAAR